MRVGRFRSSSRSRRARGTIATVAGVLLCAVSVAFPAGASAQTAREALQQDVDVLHDAGAVGVLAETVTDGRSTRARAGVRKLGSRRPVAWRTHFRAGSVMKTYIAATVLQLVGEGRLALDDTVERWLPGVIRGNGNDGRTITVRQLLNHTSGLFSYTSDEEFGATIATLDGFYANRFRHYEPRELIEFALSHPPDFAPGSDWSYSNTGYIVAGEVIEAVTGNEWDEELEDRIIEPLRLTETSIPDDDPTLPWPFAHGYQIFTTDPAQREYTDTTLHNMTWGGAAGAMITTTRDTNRFMSKLMKGRVLRPAELAKMKTVIELGSGYGYGLGLIRNPLSCGDEGYWSHDGSVVGYVTEAAVSDDGTRSLALTVSTRAFFDEAHYSAVGERILMMKDRFFCAASWSSTAASAAKRAKSVRERRAAQKLRRTVTEL